jgi:hypothetical protein
VGSGETSGIDTAVSGHLSGEREREREGDLGLSTETDVGSHDEDAKPKRGGAVCYEPTGLGWTEAELLDSEDGGVLLEGWETGHVTPGNVDQ